MARSDARNSRREPKKAPGGMYGTGGRRREAKMLADSTPRQASDTRAPIEVPMTSPRAPSTASIQTYT